MSTAPTIPSVTERVTAGAAWLNEQDPAWRDKIDLDRFALADGCFCVLGQVFKARANIASWSPYTPYDFAVQEVADADDDWARDHGFLWADGDRWDHDARRLQEAWVDEIRKPRAGAEGQTA